MRNKNLFWMAIIGLAVMTMSTMFTSCSKDDDDNFLVGTWDMYSTGYATKDGVKYEEWTDDYEGTITFESDGTCTGKGYYSGTYKIYGDVVTVDDGESKSSFTVQERTSNKIVSKPVTETETYGGHTYVYYDQLTLLKVK